MIAVLRTLIDILLLCNTGVFAQEKKVQREDVKGERWEVGFKLSSSSTQGYYGDTADKTPHSAIN